MKAPPWRWRGLRVGGRRIRPDEVTIGTPLARTYVRVPFGENASGESASGESAASGVGGEPRDRRGVGRGLDGTLESLAIAERVERLVGERVDGRDEVGRRLVPLPGRLSQVPSVDEAVEDHEPRERLSVDGTERRVDGARQRTGSRDGSRKVAHRGVEAAEHVIHLWLRGVRAAVRGGERCRAADHVLEHASDREVGARRLTVELLGADSADDVAKQGADLAELGQGIHCSSVRVEWTNRDAGAALGGFAITAGCDESRHFVRLAHGTIFAPDGRGCRRARAPFSADAADPSWGEHPIATALAAGSVAVSARCGRTAMPSRWAQPGWPGIERGESGMRASEQDLTIEMQVGDIVTRGENWDGQLVRHLSLPAGADFRPLLRGLPGDMCSCAHWGYVLSGSITLRYADGSQEVSRAGDMYYWPPGHTGWSDEGVTFVEISPAADLAPVLEHLAAQLLPLG
jgi:hypothetical protein